MVCVYYVLNPPKQTPPGLFLAEVSVGVVNNSAGRLNVSAVSGG